MRLLEIARPRTQNAVKSGAPRGDSLQVAGSWSSKCLRFNPEHARGTWLDAGLKRDPETRQGRRGPKVIFGALGEI
jgi:hypothetical protein